jgi:hypothetical protein
MPCARQAGPKSGSADRTASLTSVDIADADLFYLAALDGGFDAGTCVARNFSIAA